MVCINRIALDVRHIECGIKDLSMVEGGPLKLCRQLWTMKMFYGNICFEAKTTSYYYTKIAIAFISKCFAKCKIASQGIGLCIGIVTILY